MPAGPIAYAPTPVAPVHDAPARPARRPARRHSPTEDDRGSTTVEFALLFPLIAFLLFTGPQLALWYFARDAAQAAAASAARAASVDGAPPGTGQQAAQTYLAHVGRGSITHFTVTETDTPTTVAIHIHATVPSTIPLPGFNPSVDITVSRGRERFTTPDTP